MGKEAPIHDFDALTDFCVRCGCSHADYLNGYRPFCDKKGNVQGISHVIWQKRWRTEHNAPYETGQSSAAQARKP